MPSENTVPEPAKTSTHNIPTQPGQESRTMHRCESSTRDGRSCGRYVATVLWDGLWRCPSHRPRTKDVAAADRNPEALPPPVKILKHPSDALKLASWAALEMAAGHISPQRCAQTVAACREFRRGWAERNNADRLVSVVNRALEAVEAWAVAQGAGRREALVDATAACRATLEEWERVLGRVA